jgi:predicted metalloprotease
MTNLRLIHRRVNTPGQHLSRRRGSALGTVSMLLVLVTACGTPDTPDDTSSAVSDAIVSVAAETNGALNAFWARHATDMLAGQWTPPSDVVVYSENAPPAGSSCLDGNDPDWRDNSFYCPSDDVIYLDADWLEMLGVEFPSNPDMAVVIIEAHEFAHHIQSLTGARFNIPIGKELQADCYAGVFLSALDTGETALDIGDVDVRGALETIRGIADSDFGSSNWFAPGSHGGTAERSEAMATGYLTEDPLFCSGYELTGPISPIQVNGYTFRPPPASRVEALDDGTYRISVASHPELTLDLQSWTRLDADAVKALVEAAPTYFKGSSVQYVGRVESFGSVAQFDVSTLRYEQRLGSQTFHGALILVTRMDS